MENIHEVEIEGVHAVIFKSLKIEKKEAGIPSANPSIYVHPNVVYILFFYVVGYIEYTPDSTNPSYARSKKDSCP